MQFLKSLLLFIIGLLLIIVLAFWGFKENFPGKSIAVSYTHLTLPTSDLV